MDNCKITNEFLLERINHLEELIITLSEKIDDLQNVKSSIPTLSNYPIVEYNMEDWLDNIVCINATDLELFLTTPLNDAFIQFLHNLHIKHTIPICTNKKKLYVYTRENNKWEEFTDISYNNFVQHIWREYLKYYKENRYPRETRDEEDEDLKKIVSIRKHFCETERHKNILKKALRTMTTL